MAKCGVKQFSNLGFVTVFEDFYKKIFLKKYSQTKNDSVKKFKRTRHLQEIEVFLKFLIFNLNKKKLINKNVSEIFVKHIHLIHTKYENHFI